MKQSEKEKKLVLGKNRTDDPRLRVDAQATHGRRPFNPQPFAIIAHPLLRFFDWVRDTRSVGEALALGAPDPRVRHRGQNAQTAHSAARQLIPGRRQEQTAPVAEDVTRIGRISAKALATAGRAAARAKHLLVEQLDVRLALPAEAMMM